MNLDKAIDEGIKHQNTKDAEYEKNRILDFNQYIHKVLTGTDMRHTSVVPDYHKAFLDEGIHSYGIQSVTYCVLDTVSLRTFWGKQYSKTSLITKQCNVYNSTDIGNVLREHREAKAWAKENGVILV